MQFKHPELLWGLLLLLIPILVHLLQLRRFKKTAFTNVAMLERMVSESQKSQRLKKWLLLLTRLLLIAAFVIAFAQPFSAKEDALRERETVIYLDNSFSMQAKKRGMTLLGQSVQELIQNIPESTVFTLFTNSRTYRDVTIKEVRNELLSLPGTHFQLSLEQIGLKAASLFSKGGETVQHMVLVSDLQGRSQKSVFDEQGARLHWVKTRPDNWNNVYIDSVYLGPLNGNQIPLHISIAGLKEGETLPISLYNADKLIAKTAVEGTSSQKELTVLSIEKGKSIKGRVTIDDPVLQVDNHFYFTVDQGQKPRILGISEEDGSFLARIFTKSDFEYQAFNPKTLNYSLLNSQNTIVLNGLQAIPNSLTKGLVDFKGKGGTLIVIPSKEPIDLGSYNNFLSQVMPLKFGNPVRLEKNITSISFSHPLYSNVFKKEVSNFDYPKTATSYEVTSNGTTVLSHGDGSAFLVSDNNCYVFTASLLDENSDFINSPLIVPTFYNIGAMSLKNPSLYQTVGAGQSIDIVGGLNEDNILTLQQGENKFIPLQQSFSNKVRLTFGESPEKDGIYAVTYDKDTIQNISFNYPRSESKFVYLDNINGDTPNVYSDMTSLFTELREEASIKGHWKWFIILALVLALVELLIQKIFQ